MLRSVSTGRGIRILLELVGKIRDPAMFSLAIDSKLHGSDLMRPGSAVSFML